MAKKKQTNPKMFAFVVDGEVAKVVIVPEHINGADKMIAIYSSDPKVIEVNELYPEGTLYDGKTFTKPE